MADGPVLHGLLLAAGGSSRFDGPKQLARFEGESLLRRAALAARQVLGSRVTVVLGADAGRLAAEIEGLELCVLVHEAWRDGLGASLRAGIGALPASSDAALVMLSDQPLVDAQALKRLKNAWERNPDRPAAGAYGNTLGAPAIIPRPFFPEIGCASDAGAKPLLLRHRESVSRVPMPEAAFDVDTRESLRALRGA